MGQWGKRIASSIEFEGVLYEYSLLPHIKTIPFQEIKDGDTIDDISLIALKPRVKHFGDTWKIRYLLEQQYVGRIVSSNGTLKMSEDAGVLPFKIV